jgi:tetratricopeptide (TPR) repeat protein
MLATAQNQATRLKPLCPPDSHFLNAAQGWLDLSDPKSAEEELNQVSLEGRAHPLFLFVRWELYAKTGKWPIALLLAQYLVQLCPQEPLAWLQRSYSLYALRRGNEAFQQLLPAAHKFEKEHTVAYHLACYAAQLGYIQEAWHWLDKAIALGNPDSIKSLALEDPLLAPLWEHLGECLSSAPGFL